MSAMPQLQSAHSLRPSAAPALSNTSYAKLLIPRVRTLLPEEIRSVGIDISPQGGVRLGTYDAEGRGPKRLIPEGELPFYVDIELPDGRCLTVEVSSCRPDAALERELAAEMERVEQDPPTPLRPIAVLCQTCPDPPVNGWRRQIQPAAAMGLLS
jgi:hypothetical protein